MANLQGGDDLKRRLKAVRLAFKPIGKRWADTAVDLGTAQAADPARPRCGRATGTRPARLAGVHQAQDGHAAQGRGRRALHRLLHRRRREAALMAKRTPGVKQDRTVFAKKHPGYKARPFRAYIAHESLRRNPMAETLIEEWNRSA